MTPGAAKEDEVVLVICRLERGFWTSEPPVEPGLSSEPAVSTFAVLQSEVRSVAQGIHASVKRLIHRPSVYGDEVELISPAQLEGDIQSREATGGRSDYVVQFRNNFLPKLRFAPGEVVRAPRWLAESLVSGSPEAFELALEDASGATPSRSDAGGGEGAVKWIEEPQDLLPVAYLLERGFSTGEVHPDMRRRDLAENGFSIFGSESGKVKVGLCEHSPRRRAPEKPLPQTDGVRVYGQERYPAMEIQNQNVQGGGGPELVVGFKNHFLPLLRFEPKHVTPVPRWLAVHLVSKSPEAFAPAGGDSRFEGWPRVEEQGLKPEGAPRAS